MKMDYNIESLSQLITDILAEAKRQGATQSEVDVGVNQGFSVQSRKGSVESIEYNQDKIVDVTVYLGKRTGSSSLSDVRPDAIRSAVSAACNIARFTDEDPAAGIADKEDLAFQYSPVDLSFPWAISVEEAIQKACECENYALSRDKRIVSSEGVSV